MSFTHAQLLFILCLQYGSLDDDSMSFTKNSSRVRKQKGINYKRNWERNAADDNKEEEEVPEGKFHDLFSFFFTSTFPRAFYIIKNA